MLKKISIILFSVFSVGWLVPMHASGVYTFKWMEIQQRHLLMGSPPVDYNFSRANIACGFFEIGIIWFGIVLFIWVYIGARKLFCRRVN